MDLLAALGTLWGLKDGLHLLRVVGVQLEQLSPAMAEAKTKATRRARMRAYIKARASFALTGELDDEARAALDFYLRHGSSRRRPAEG